MTKIDMTDSELAFEYVLGTLRGTERQAAEQRRREDPEFARQIAFWEEQMMAMQKPALMPAPPNTWDKIAAQLDTPEKKPARSWREILILRWALAASFALFIGVFSYTTLTRIDPALPNASYAAILTTSQGKAALTALTSSDNQRLWLKWEEVKVSSEQSLQLWAISKRDGEARSLAVFDQSGVNEVKLDEATARLIHDSAELVLTIEETGGSALDQPSEQLVARGVCVRLGKA